MTPEEKAWCERVHRQAMDLVGILGNIELDCDPASKQAKRSHRAALMALDLATEAAQRMTGAEMAAELASGYDLAALSNLPMGKTPEPTETQE